MTQRHISHPEGLPACAGGHSARHILDLRGVDRGGGHLVECKCRATSKHAQADQALAEWRRINRPARRPRRAQPAQCSNVVQIPLRLVATATETAT